MKNISKILFFTFLISSSWGQNNIDTLKIFFSNGFNDDAIDLSINNIQVLNKEVLKSSPIYGLTGSPLLITGQNKIFVVTCESYNCKNTKIKLRKIMKVNLIWKENKYEWKFEIKKGKFFIIYFNGRSNQMEMMQYLIEPGFD